MCGCGWGGGLVHIIMRKVDACLEWPPRLKARCAMTTDTKERKQAENQDGSRVGNDAITMHTQ